MAIIRMLFYEMLFVSHQHCSYFYSFVCSHLAVLFRTLVIIIKHLSESNEVNIWPSALFFLYSYCIGLTHPQPQACLQMIKLTAIKILLYLLQPNHTTDYLLPLRLKPRISPVHYPLNYFI